MVYLAHILTHKLHCDITNALSYSILAYDKAEPISKPYTYNTFRSRETMTQTRVERAVEGAGCGIGAAAIASAVVTLIVMVTFVFLDESYKSELVPLGIVSYEFAGTAEVGREMVNSWNCTERLFVSFVLGYDFLFMLLYSVAICLSCLWASRNLDAPTWVVSAGIVLAYSQFIAAFFDAIENVNLFIGLLFPDDSGSAFPIAAVCAGIKFAIVGIGIMFVIVAILLRAKGAAFGAKSKPGTAATPGEL